MTIYNFISTILSYVFTVIIYMFIFAVIRLIYMDVKKMSRFANEDNNSAITASLRTLKPKVPITSELKRRYSVYEGATIGRNKRCDIVIDEKFVSGEHLRIWYEDGEWYLEDLGSRNGTFVNGSRIKDTVILDPQDKISVGGLEFVFE